MYFLDEIRLNIYEMFESSKISEREKDFLIDKTFEKQLYLFFEETNYLDDEFNIDCVLDSVVESIQDNDFVTSKLIVYESFNERIIDSDLKEDIFYYIREAETDYANHMIRKKLAERYKNGGDPLFNKKYKKNKDGTYANTEKVRRAEIKYALADKPQESKDTKRVTNAYTNEELITIKSPKETDIRLLEYMKKKANSDDPKDHQLYEKLFKRFCQKWNIEENSTLWVRFNADFIDGKGRKLKQKGALGVAARKDSKEFKNDDPDGSNNKKEKFFKLTPDYVLLHRSPKELTELKPAWSSNQYEKDDHKGSGQYHRTGRVYFYLKRRDEKLSGGYGKGQKIYELDANVPGFYIDSDNKHSRNMDLIKNPEDLVGKAVYVKTSIPLKVKKYTR